MQDASFDVGELRALEARNARPFDFVRFDFCDLSGVCRTSIVPRRHVEANLSHGLSVFCGLMSIGSRGDFAFQDEMKEFKFGNMRCIPCKGTLRNCEWVKLSAKEKSDEKDDWQVGSVMVELQWPKHFKGGEMGASCARVALKRQLQRLEHLGYSLLSAFEVEFTLYQADGRKPAFNGKDDSACQVLAKFENYLYTIERYLERSGVDISVLRVENGEGQFELVMHPKFGIETCDDTLRLKEAVKEMSSSLGYVASFMAQSSEHVSANGFHLNLSLWKRTSENGPSTNAFYDPDAPDHMSVVFRCFLAGLLKHARALAAFTSPTANCYRRLHSFMTPHKIDWAIDHRSVAFRVKKGDPSLTYLENRLPSSACNPYLATTATIAAGLDGIINRLPLPKSNNDVLNAENYHSLDSSDPDANHYLPYSLQEALTALEDDVVLKEALGEELVRWFVTVKRKFEVDAFNGLDQQQKWAKERQLYFEFI